MRRYPLEWYLFLAVLAMTVLPIFVVDYVVTTDGPCHLYNSQILYDWHWKGESEFYEPFLFLNKQLEPNWLTNLIQVPLLGLFNAVWAEKIFFLLYLLTFAFGFRTLVLTINPKAGFLSSLGILFAWHHILLTGFTNNAWSIALWFWVVAFWIRSFEREKLSQYLGLALLLFTTYLAHPVGLMMSLISVVVITFFRGVLLVKDSHKKALEFLFAQGVKFLLIALPVLILFGHFFLRRQWKPETSGSGALDGFLKLTALVSLSSREEGIVFALALFILVLFSYSLYGKIRSKQLENDDGFLLLVLVVLLLALNPPSGFSGGLDLGIRLGMFPYLCMLFWIAAGSFPSWLRAGIPIVALLFAVTLLSVRLPVQIEASKLAAEVVSCKDHIEERSTLLTLNYDWSGQTPDGQVIADRNWLFRHFDCYLGLYRQLIISDNYEANYWYFPLIERWQTNMYTQTAKDGINFEHRPPRADILSYRQRTGGQDIDYVLLLSYREEFGDHPYTKEIFAQLDAAYTRVFVSENGRAVLYRRE